MRKTRVRALKAQFVKTFGRQPNKRELRLAKTGWKRRAGKPFRMIAVPTAQPRASESARRPRPRVVGRRSAAMAAVLAATLGRPARG